MRVGTMILSRDLGPRDLQRVSQTANQFQSRIIFSFDEDNIELDAKSLLGMMLLIIRNGTQLTIRTKGEDEEEALGAVRRVLTGNDHR